MNTEQLKTFLCLVEAQNFSKAAEILFVSQSTVSKRIQELERETNQQLFVRDHSGIRLSRPGVSFLEYARQIIHMEERAVALMGRTNQYSDYLVLGAAYAYYELYLCDILPSYLEQHPDISVRIKSGHSAFLINQLRQAMIDVAYVHHPYSHPEYVCERVAEDELVLVTDSNNQSLRRGITHFEIKDLPLIHSNFLYASTYNWLFPKNHQFQLETDLVSDALPLLKEHKWCAFFPRKMVDHLIAENELAEVQITDGALPPVQYFAVFHKDKLLQRAGKEWLTFTGSSSHHEE